MARTNKPKVAYFILNQLLFKSLSMATHINQNRHSLYSTKYGLHTRIKSGIVHTQPNTVRTDEPNLAPFRLNQSGIVHTQPNMAYTNKPKVALFILMQPNTAHTDEPNLAHFRLNQKWCSSYSTKYGLHKQTKSGIVYTQPNTVHTNQK